MIDLPTPTLEGKFGKAWEIDAKAKVAALGGNPDHDGTVALWVVYAPWAHPVWHSYAIYMVHLRPIDRGDTVYKAEHIYLEGATHEIWVKALNPDVPVAQMIETGQMSWLSPSNFASQMIFPDGDDEAAAAARAVAQDIVDGRLNPDTDAVQQWKDRFGDNMFKR